MVTCTASRPKRAASGARASVRAIVEQLGLVTMQPAPAALSSLDFDEHDMLVVHFRDHQRHVGFHAV